MVSIVRDAMVSHLVRRNLLSIHQHGFLKGHSAGRLQILECINDWPLLIESGKFIDVCYIDFSRAFDTESILKLLHKINAYGFKGKLHAWLADFFKYRKLCVKVGNFLSNCFLQTIDIAQGT